MPRIDFLKSQCSECRSSLETQYGDSMAKSYVRNIEFRNTRPPPPPFYTLHIELQSLRIKIQNEIMSINQYMLSSYFKINK